METKETQQVLDEARKQGRGDSMMDLVFDPETGEFKQVDKGTQVDQGQVVTGMTEDGFAA